MTYSANIRIRKYEAKKKKCEQSQTKINGKKICHSFYKGLISLTYEELLEMYKKMTNHPVGK